MLKKIVYKFLIEIQNHAYPDVRHNAFYLELVKKNYKTMLGDWDPISGGANKIRIFSLDRPTPLIIEVAVHELAHNVENTIHKKTGHTKQFYGICKKLIESGIELGVFKYEDVLMDHDIHMIKKYYGELDVKECIGGYKSESCIIKVYNSYVIKDTLKAIGFSFNKTEGTWDKEILKVNIEELKTDLLGLTDEKNIKIVDFSNLDIDIHKYIVIGGNSFENKEKLKELKYFFRDKKWMKKVLSSKVDQEIELLKNENLEGIEIGIAIAK